ncbi:hypothetical protein ACFC01_52920 [Streptomyces mirabilis]|uniref:hypothetical protein n=1 Tax=Streptomyces mirabilis TaxID=68239 RepID=UPI0035D7D5DD
MKRKRIAALALATATLVGGGLAGASSASASTAPDGSSWDHTWTTADSAQGGTVYVEEHGDVIKVCDTAADGLAPRIQVWAETSIAGEYALRYTGISSGGLGSCSTYSASDGGSYDLPEGDEILITIWLGPSLPSSTSTSHYYLNDH